VVARASSNTECCSSPAVSLARSSPAPCGPRARRQPHRRRLAGGLISHLFDLKNKVGKSELDELIRSVGVNSPRRKEI